MTGLLRQLSSSGYPADFLFARLRGKRQHLAAGPGDSWEQLQQDYRWTYAAMSVSLRKSFAPCFLLVELRSLQMLLRLVEGKNRPQLERICAHSLLNGELLKSTMLCPDTDALLELFDRWFACLLSNGQSIAGLHKKGGNRLVEEALVDALLQTVSAPRQKAEIAEFIAGQIDLRNLLTAARYLRWQLDDPKLLAGGGDISRQLRAAKDSSGLEATVSRLSGQAGNDIALIETEFLRKLGRRIEVSARDPLGLGLVVDYLWRRYQAFRQAGLNSWAGVDAGAWEATL